MSFVNVQRLTKSKKRPAQETSDPSWAEVEKTLRTLGEAGGARLQLADADEVKVMTVYGQDGAFHIGIAVDGSEFHFYTNGKLDDEEELATIAWSQVPKAQVCRDLERTVAVVKKFFDSGERLDTVTWISERF